MAQSLANPSSVTRRTRSNFSTLPLPPPLAPKARWMARVFPDPLRPLTRRIDSRDAAASGARLRSAVALWRATVGSKCFAGWRSAVVRRRRARAHACSNWNKNDDAGVCREWRCKYEGDKATSASLEACSKVLDEYLPELKKIDGVTVNRAVAACESQLSRRWRDAVAARA